MQRRKTTTKTGPLLACRFGKQPQGRRRDVGQSGSGVLRAHQLFTVELEARPAWHTDCRLYLHVREATESNSKPGEYVESSITWRKDDVIEAGTRVEATDGPLGVVRERVVGEAPEHAYLGVEATDGLYYVPERLVRESSADTVYLSLPRADARAQSSRDRLPIRRAHDELPREPS